MTISRTGTALLLVVLAAFFIGCNALALGGDKKYKVDLQNILLNIKDQVENEGMVNENTYNKFKNFMNKNQEEYGTKGSYIKAEEVLKSIELARSEPSNAFHHYQQAVVDITFVQDMLKTEVPD